MNAPPDNCGNCLTPGRAVTVPPYHVRTEGGNSVRGFYGCPECGFRWTTGWLLPLTPGQAAASARLLDEEPAA